MDIERCRTAATNMAMEHDLVKDKILIYITSKRLKIYTEDFRKTTKYQESTKVKILITRYEC